MSDAEHKEADEYRSDAEAEPSPLRTDTPYQEEPQKGLSVRRSRSRGPSVESDRVLVVQQQQQQQRTGQKIATRNLGATGESSTKSIAPLVRPRWYWLLAALAALFALLHNFLRWGPISVKTDAKMEAARSAALKHAVSLACEGVKGTANRNANTTHTLQSTQDSTLKDLGSLKQDLTVFDATLRSLESRLITDCREADNGASTISQVLKQQQELRDTFRQVGTRLAKLHTEADDLEQTTAARVEQLHEAVPLHQQSTQATEAKLNDMRALGQRHSDALKGVELAVQELRKQVEFMIPKKQLQAFTAMAARGSGDTSLADEAEERDAVEQQVHKQFVILQEQATAAAQEAAEQQRALPAGSECLSSIDKDDMIDEAVAKFAADRTGMIDLAHRAAGGSVVYTGGLTSETFIPAGSYVPLVKHKLGLEAGVGGAEEAISHDARLNACWAMRGDHGQLTVELARPATVQSVSIEHVSWSSALDSSSALKDFEVYGLSSPESQPVLLLRGRYDLRGYAVQKFKVDPTLPQSSEEFDDGIFPMVTLKILSNHGKKDYTCLYRLRVHGAIGGAL